MRRATALAVPVRALSWSISSYIIAIHSSNVRCSQKLRKIRQNSLFWKFKIVQRIDVDKTTKPVTSECYDKQHVCIYLQLFSH